MTYESAIAALADRTRRAIFEALRAGPRPVGDLARGFAVSRPAVSQHLRVLSEAGLCQVAADGRQRIYAIDPEGVAALRHWLDGLWDDALAAFADAAARDVEERNR